LDLQVKTRVAPDPHEVLSERPALVPLIVLVLGLLIFAVPTMFSVIRMSWSTEQGAHGPIVMATGLWVLHASWKEHWKLAGKGSLAVTAIVLVPCLLVYGLARVTGITEIEGFAMYGALLGVLYALVGGALMKKMWFPLIYLAFVFPPPDSFVAAATQPLKIAISQAAVWLLYEVGYPIANSGVTIQVGQFQLLVAAACAGLNSMISLTAIGLFYVYLRHNANWRYAAILMFAIIPIAALANFIRVLLLILITYHFGDAAAQGFIHNFAGITMFLAALLLVFGLDLVASPLRRRLQGGG
jgi:exosortase B